MQDANDNATCRSKELIKTAIQENDFLRNLDLEQMQEVSLR